MQALVYIFVALAGLGVAATGYFGLTFTPIEAVLAALVFGGVAVLLIERSQRLRAEARLEKAVGDLSRLLSTDAQAGSVLSQRINAISDSNAGPRLDAVEGDISVLGTVVRQVAEAVAELEEARRNVVVPAAVVEEPPPVEDDRMPEPVIPLEMLKQAIDDNRLTYHIEPIVTLPQRRTYGYDLVPRLMLEDGELADPPDFMPLKGGEGVVRRIERLATEEAITVARRARTAGQPVTLFVPVSRATFADRPTVDQLLAILDANRALSDQVLFSITDKDWRGWTAIEKDAASAMVKKGAGFSLTGVRSLRADFADLAARGVRSIRVDAGRFIADPTVFTDFHTADIAAYVKRFGIDLILTNARSEQQVVALLEDGIGLVQGPHIAGPGPVRADLLVDRSAETQGQRRVGA